jgi:hypothetical protein
MKTLKVYLIGFLLAGAFLLQAQDNFQFTYSASGDDVLEWIIPSTDGNLILAGNTNSIDPSGDALIIKTDLNGNIIWSKTYGGSGLDVLTKIIPCTGGGYAAVGYTNSDGQGDQDAWFFRINEDGVVKWADCLGTWYWDSARGIVQCSDGGFLVVGQLDIFDFAFMIKLNSKGELVWKREFMLDIVLWFNEVYETEEGGFIFTGALNYDGFGIHDTFILETDATGNRIRCKVYGEYNNDSFRTLVPFQDGFLAAGDTWSWEGHQLGWLTMINRDLSVGKSVVLGDNSANQYLESACIISNSIFADIKLADGNAYIIELDSSLNLTKSWKFNPGVSSYSSHLFSPGDSSLIFSGSITDAGTQRKDAYLTKFNPFDSTYDCNTMPHSTFITGVEVQSGDLNFVEVENQGVFEQISIESNDISLESNILCNLPPLAEFSSPDETCTNDPISVINNSGYGETFKWYFEGAIPATSDSFDPGIIAYEYPGYFSIKLVVSNELGADSLVRYITVKQAPVVFLGADTTLQGTQQLILDAGPDMDHYLWQDGSNGQTLQVSEAGIYWAIVEKNFCYSSDTILVTNENAPLNVVLSPNPATGSVKITSESGEIPSSVAFYNSSGMRTKDLQPSGNLIDINDLEPGFYIMELVFHENIIRKRLLIF